MALSRAVVGAIFLYATVSFTAAKVTLPSSSEKSTAGTTVRPFCDVTEGETFDGWYDPKGQKITTDAKVRVHVVSAGTRHTLVIREINAATDGGIYQCRGDSNKGEFTLNIGFIADPPKKQRLFLNKKGKILLDAHGYPNPTTKWKKDGKVFSPAALPRFTELEDGSLEISKVEVADEGAYNCFIAQGIITKSVDIEVRVFEQSRITVAPQAVREVTEGYNTTFKCNATGRPVPKIEWVDQNDRPIDSLMDKRFSISGGALTITGIVNSDTLRTYTCKASNSDDEKEHDEATASITKVWVAPKLDPIEDQTKDQEQKVTLVCQATAGDRPVSVVWKLGGSRFRDQKQEASKSTIVFEKVQVENSGQYVCEATNGAKDSKGMPIVVREEAMLFVKSPPKLNKQKSTTPVYSFIGNPNSVKIVCEFFGFPLPNVTITSINGTVLSEGLSTVTYEIKETTLNSFGTFHCSARNKNGNATHKVELKKAGAPEKVNNLKGVPTCKSILVKWDAPTFDGGMPITKYDVKIMDENNNEVIAQTVNAPDTEYNHAQDIVKEKQYKLEVFARSSFPDRGPSVTATTTTTKFCAPSKPSFKNTEKNLEELKLKLRWSKPDDDGGNSDIKYEVSILGYEDGKLVQNETVDKTTEELEMELDSRYVKAGRTYYFKVTAINEGGRSEAGSLRVTVDKNAAGPPAVGARKQGVSSGVVAAIVIVVILIVLIVIDLLCCYFNDCGVFFCCRKTICGVESSEKYEKKNAEMEKLRTENV